MKEAAHDGAIDLYFLDESGFLPTLPTSYTWAREGVRAVVPYEASERRRVNVFGALAPFGAHPRLVYESHTTKLGSAAFLTFVWWDVAGLPQPADLADGLRRERPCVIVLDNYSVHHSKPVKAAQPLLAAAGVTFFYLPPYAPELNQIEPLWRQVKYQDLPVRSHTTLAALTDAVDTALARRATEFIHSTTYLCEAA